MRMCACEEEAYRNPLSASEPYLVSAHYYLLALRAARSESDTYLGNKIAGSVE